LKDVSYAGSEKGFLKAQLLRSAGSDESERLAILQSFLELERQRKSNTEPDSGTVVGFPGSKVKLAVIRN
jgi:hypothetical protein